MLLPGPAPANPQMRLRILAHEVILSRDPPQGLSALNVLPVTVLRIDQGLVQMALDGPAGHERMLAQITPRSVKALELRPGIICHAIIKSVSILPS